MMIYAANFKTNLLFVVTSLEQNSKNYAVAKTASTAGSSNWLDF